MKGLTGRRKVCRFNISGVELTRDTSRMTGRSRQNWHWAWGFDMKTSPPSLKNMTRWAPMILPLDRWSFPRMPHWETISLGFDLILNTTLEMSAVTTTMITITSLLALVLPFAPLTITKQSFVGVEECSTRGGVLTFLKILEQFPHLL